MKALYLSLAMSVVLLTACSQTAFDSAKQSTLSNPVFPNDNNPPPSGEVPTPTPNPNPTPTPPPNTGESTAYLFQPGQTEVKVWLYCSTRNKNVLGRSNFKYAYAYNEPIQLGVNGFLCTNNRDVIRNLILQDKVSLAQLRSICPSIVPQSGMVIPEVYVNNRALSGLSGRTNVLEVHYAAYVRPYEPVEEPDANCDQSSSPLVVHLGSNVAKPEAIKLSSKEEGVRFDLLGSLNSHNKLQISWFANDQYRFVALPNRQGEVLGIDQLFGDSTLGPDGEYAANGYAALAKHDLNRDNFIDRRDPIFKHLRLWHDANRNGIGEREELTLSLSDANIAFIDLRYSEDFAETDRWGNQTLMKSVIGYTNGTLDLIFDLWFAYRLNH